MAVVAAGLMIGPWGKSKSSPSTSEFMEHFWEYLVYVPNALIFLMVGLQIDLDRICDEYPPIHDRVREIDRERLKENETGTGIG